MNEPINLNDFELLDMIASGSFSEVYKVKERNTGKILAAKISIKKDDNDLNKASIFTREINIISKISYPAIIKFVGYNKFNFSKDPYPVIITEFLPNGTLNDIIYLENYPQAEFYLNFSSKLILIYGIVSAMSYLHSNKILHRDLKPSNILIDDFLCPKISDFGLSKQITNKDDYIETKLIGTPLYLAPESWLRYEYTEKSDVYAFSLILYELMTTERPFKNCEPSEIAAKVTKGIRPSFMSTSLPPSYRRLITRCWSQEQNDRPSFDQILIELRENPEFVEFISDKSDYYNYIKYMDSQHSNVSPQSFSIDEFTNRQSHILRRFRIVHKNTSKNNYFIKNPLFE